MKGVFTIMLKKLVLQLAMCTVLFFAFTAVSYAAEIVIDYGDPGYSETGKWLESSNKGYGGSSTRYSNVGDGTAKWTPNIVDAGEYEVSIYKIFNASAGNSNVKIEVVHDTVTDTVYQDWTTGESGWVSLGKFSFAAGTAGHVIIYGEPSELNKIYTRADAVKFVNDISSPEPPKTVIPADTYYVDSINGNDVNDGTSAGSPWKTLDKLNSHIYQPGTKILLNRGSYWQGQLKPKGSGSDGNPIIIDSYGTGNKPIIDGNGIVNEGVVHIINEQYWEISNLEIVNDAPIADIRYGIFIELNDYGTANHIYIKDCYIHNIKGDNTHPHKGVGIFYYVSSKDDSKFNDILIEKNTVKNVDRSGIILRSPEGTFSTGLVIRNNFVEDIGGDGIVAKTSKEPLVEYNIAKETSARSNKPNAAIWTWYVDDAVIQYNESYNTVRLPNNADANGFDSDFNSNRNIFQYNYSHDNGGGFILIINVGGSYNDSTIVRYNISQNDKKNVVELSGDLTNAQFYNNTFYLDSLSSAKLLRVNNYFGIPKSASFKNNIFYNLGSGGYDIPKVENLDFDSNIFYGMNAPVPTEVADITVVNSIFSDPKLVNPGSGNSLINFNDPNKLSGYKLQSDSPAINAGLVIENNGGKDFWGNPLYHKQPDIGAFEYSVKPDPGAGGVGNGNSGSGGNTGSVIITTTPLSEDASLYLPKETELRKESLQDGGQAVSVVMDSTRLAQKLAVLQAKENPMLAIQIPGDHSSIAVKLPLSTLYNSFKVNSKTILSIRSHLGSFELPLALLQHKDIKNAAASSEATLIVRMNKSKTSVTQQLEQAVEAQGLEQLSSLIDFKVMLEAGGKVAEIRSFGDSFVTRIIKVNGTIKDISQVTAVSYDSITGQLKFAPSFVTVKNGQTEVMIMSNTSGMYTIVQSKKTFEDMIGHWAKSDVERLAAKLIIKGTTDRYYSPDQPVTRAQFAALLVRGLGLTSETVSNVFTDVADSEWYAAEVNIAAQYGLVQGAGLGKFNPDLLVTREQMVVMMMNAVRFFNGSSIKGVYGDVPFVDQDQLSSYARDAVAEAVHEGLISGKTATTFAPQAAATRVEAAVLLKQTLQYLKLMN